MTYPRYAIYAAPEGALWDAGSHWLGWDAARGAALPQPEVAGLPRPLAEITEAPRKYGFHATIKPPFRLHDGVTAEDLAWAVEALCLRLSPVVRSGLRLDRIGGFLALVPEAGEDALSDLAARVVEALDPFRAPPTANEIARRNPDRLTPRQRAYLDLWGYPYVMEEFQFHMTLSGDLPPAEGKAVSAVLSSWIAPHLPRPFAIDSLCLFGEAMDGRFHLLHRYTLTG
jgi:putative phosphonate metabolism protein